MNRYQPITGPSLQDSCWRRIRHQKARGSEFAASALTRYPLKRQASEWIRTDAPSRIVRACMPVEFSSSPKEDLLAPRFTAVCIERCLRILHTHSIVCDYCTYCECPILHRVRISEYSSRARHPGIRCGTKSLSLLYDVAALLSTS